MFRARLARSPPPRPVVLKLPRERVFMGEKHQGAPGAAMEGQGRTGNTREKTRTTCRVLTALTLVRLKTRMARLETQMACTTIESTNRRAITREAREGQEARGKTSEDQTDDGRPGQGKPRKAMEGQGRPGKALGGLTSRRSEDRRMKTRHQDPL